MYNLKIFNILHIFLIMIKQTKNLEPVHKIFVFIAYENSGWSDWQACIRAVMK